MCGIAGQLLLGGGASLARVRAMCDAIHHRGPDDEGFHIDGPCGLGMRRLSIIDLNTGHQPISNEDGSVWVVFNGEIYNYQGLRSDLISRGHRFKTNSDTETIVHLYEEFGPESPAKLRGMFAYAIWDARKRLLFMARDRFGKKPLYYAAGPDGLTFGSELKCLREAGVPLEIDDEALRLYFLLSYIPDPWSPYRAIRKLEPGSWMMYHADGRMEQGAYWKLPVPRETAPPDLTEEQAAARVRELFDEAVRLRLIADVPLGAFLSGGIDSSAIVASMALQTKEPVKTFSIGFEEAEYNELPYARMIAEKYRTDHHEIMVRPDSVDLVSRIGRHFDEPIADTAAIPTFIVSQFAVRDVKVVLTGDGGDEIFGGYESFFGVERLRWADSVPHFARGALSWLTDRLPYSAYGKNYLRILSRQSALERYFESSVTPHFLLARLLTRDWMQHIGDDAYLAQTMAHCLAPNGADVLTQAMYFEATAKLTGNMLVKVDRMSMANSLEVRCPLLDHVLAEYAAQIPHCWKIRNGRGKQVFIKAMGDRLPRELVERPKHGFGVPIAQWIRGSLREFVWDHLTGSEFLGRGIVSPAFVRHLLLEHDRKRRNNTAWIWMLLMLELWFRDARPARPIPAAAVEVTS
jgi:asparagine synthase (glutamine-hydrolysing)